jgi:hypothetical protein
VTRHGSAARAGLARPPGNQPGPPSRPTERAIDRAEDRADPPIDRRIHLHPGAVPRFHAVNCADFGPDRRAAHVARHEVATPRANVCGHTPLQSLTAGTTSNNVLKGRSFLGGVRAT